MNIDNLYRGIDRRLEHHHLSFLDVRPDFHDQLHVIVQLLLNLAVGSAYTASIEGGVCMTPEQLEQNGLNVSMAYTDFMIGSAELNIYGITGDGAREPVFLKGIGRFNESRITGAVPPGRLFVLIRKI